MNEIKQSGFERENAEAVSIDPINPKIRQMEVIDTDFHFTPSWKTIRSYLKEPFQSLLFHYPVGSLEYNPEPANEKPGVGQDTHGVAATGADVLELVRRIRARVRQVKGIELQPEVLLYGKRWEDVL